jgi:hypothetical protein
MSAQQRRWLATDTGKAVPESLARAAAMSGLMWFSRWDFLGSFLTGGSTQLKSSYSMGIVVSPVC